MNFLNQLFGKKYAPIKSYNEFWDWFLTHEKAFYKVVKEGKNFEKDFFDKLSPKLKELKDGFFFLTGMKDANTAELIFTADGEPTNIVFVEELVEAAPAIEGWLFTALKPALDINDVYIKMGGYDFRSENLFFYADEIDGCPDEIAIKIIHNDFNADNKQQITNGIYIFLDNFLGELNSVTTIDNLTVIGKQEAEKELIPIEKLKSYLIWREKEFIEKYEGIRHNTENDTYSALEAKLQNGNPLVAIINRELLEWDAKASHPWVISLEMKYDGTKRNGLPDDKTYKRLGEIENELLTELKDSDGYLNIGRQTADNVREVYFACKDFRKPSKVLYKVQQKYLNEFGIAYEIYKDKYWRSFNRFR
jgi:hypothetical protein